MSNQGETRGSWKKDPTGRHFGRWWDGEAWTDHVVSAEKITSTDPYLAAPEASMFPDSPPPMAPSRPAAPPTAAAAPSPSAAPAAPTVRGPVPTRPGWTPPEPKATRAKASGGVVAAVRGWPRGVKWAVGVFLLILVIGAAAGGGDEDKTVSATGDQAVSTQATLNHTPASIPPREPAPTPPPTQATTSTAAGPKTTFGNGTHRVGVDIAAGTYVAPGGGSCYWERQSVFGGSGSGAIIANEFARGGQVVVTIAASDKGFKTSGCGTWTAS